MDRGSSDSDTSRASRRRPGTHAAHSPSKDSLADPASVYAARDSPYLERTSCGIVLSSTNSATSFFNRSSSSCSWNIVPTWFTSRHAYSAYPAIEGLFADPYSKDHLRDRHAMLCLLHTPTICSTPNHFFFIQSHHRFRLGFGRRLTSTMFTELEAFHWRAVLRVSFPVRGRRDIPQPTAALRASRGVLEH